MDKDNMKHRRLQELKSSDFEIVDGEPDIRGWDVKLSTGEKIGDVEELIVDAKTKKVRYLVVDLDNDKLELEDREVLIPIGMATLHGKDDDVILSNIGVQQIRSLPEYDKDRLDHEMESRICSSLGRTGHRTNFDQVSNTSSAAAGSKAYLSEIEPEPDFYKHDYYNDDNLYRDRLHQVEKNKAADSEYENGLRLWERRSQGGVIQDQSGSTGSTRNTSSSIQREERVEDESMMHVRNNRNNQQSSGGRSDEGRSSSSGRSNRRNTIEDRIRNEGLQ
jgi:sporulation protein YlmC with PRC-barrel domain